MPTPSLRDYRGTITNQGEVVKMLPSIRLSFRSSIYIFDDFLAVFQDFLQNTDLILVESGNIRRHLFPLQQIAAVEQFVIYFVDDRTLPVADEIGPDRFGHITC